jgi:hypothetical protein
MTMIKEEIRNNETEFLYQMKCFESDYFNIHPDEGVWIMRVPGGWIFDFYKTPPGDVDPITTKCVFVPYSDEFKPTL